MSDINKYTTKEVLNKVLLDSSGNAVNAYSHTSQEAFNAALDDANSRLNVNLVGGTIGGDVTINGDLTVNGDGAGAYDEIVNGDLHIKSDSGNSTNAFLVEKNDGTDVFIVDTTNSRIGINSTPSRTFQVDGTASATTATGYFYTNAIHTGVDTQSVVSIRSDNASSNGNVLHVQGDGTGNLLTLSKDGSDKLTVTHEGNVGIGRTPTQKLDIYASSGNQTIMNELGGAGNAELRLKNNAGDRIIRASSDKLQFIDNADSRADLSIDGSGNSTFAGKVAIASDFNAGELLGVKGSVGSDWGARIENTSSTGAGALIKSATTNAGVQLFQVRSGSDNVFTITGDQKATFSGDITVSSATDTKPILKLEQTGNNINGGQFIFLTSGTANDNDLSGVIRFKGMNDAVTPEEIEYATIYAKNTDVSDGSEDGELHFRTMSAGSLDSRLTLKWCIKHDSW
jgi:hypothetical protein